MQQVCGFCYCAQFGHICGLKAHTVDYLVTDAVVHLIYGVCVGCAPGGANQNNCESRISLNSLQPQHAVQSVTNPYQTQSTMCHLL